MIKLSWFVLSVFLIVEAAAFAEDKAPAKASEKAKERTAVLNFEGEVIEGQKKTPDLFLQTEVQKLSLESVLYQRKDFNDFHTVDSKQRPRLPDLPRKEPVRR